ncbi:hypothetical protein [Actinomadura alba]|uniref:Asp23/Gls24 family envelope stress response protein n=1 Tax=Actinomadura alba TaxID=406431 RepID=A0ABR7LXF3_9ACTN|nr:hypothetical protein [Actinomadura alba]MBC6469538.1 hypothetical protein [Actinomadura alba]
MNVKVSDHLDSAATGRAGSGHAETDRAETDRAETDRLDAGRDAGGRAGLALAVASAVEAVPGVVRLVGGRGPLEVATLYRHGKVVGVRHTDRTVIVHIAVGVLPLQGVTRAVGETVRQVLSRAGDDRDVAVVVDELEGVSAFPETGRHGPAAGRTPRSGR